MKIGDLVYCTDNGHNSVCIIVHKASKSWWEVAYPDGTIRVVHIIYMRSVR